MQNRNIIIFSPNQQELQENQQSIENHTYQAQSINAIQYQYQNMQQPQIQRIKLEEGVQKQPLIKIRNDIQINLERQGYFQKIFQSVSDDINANNQQYNLYPYIKDDQVIFQFWKFEFKGQGNFQDRYISGILKLKPDHPLSAPIFYFDPIHTDQGDEVIQNESVYGDHSLCIPLFSYWKKTTKEQEILQAIEQNFNNPSWSQSDVPANPLFAYQSEQEKQKIQNRQAQFLPFFEKQI
ncbi:unnamed protein product [Paramecium pentaurelia]|uniref:Uncharacterized protein n=1 Tax=Paramecium pentaurelia TaxID=43138 RepID=A0A8S1TDU1_9CILI|nr:unnamed protein product [Paramecium pentaurelia]